MTQSPEETGSASTTTSLPELPKEWTVTKKGESIISDSVKTDSYFRLTKIVGRFDMAVVKDTDLVIEKLFSSKEDLHNVFQSWREAYNLYQENYASPEYYQSSTGDFINHYNLLHSILWVGIDDDMLISDEPLNSNDYKKLNNGGYGLIKQLLEDEGFDKKSEILSFLTYELHDAWTSHILTSGRMWGGVDADFDNAFKHKKQLIVPLFENWLRQSAETENVEEGIATIFEGLSDIGEEGEAMKLLFLEDITAKQRLKVAVECANSFGYITTIDWIAAKNKDPHVSETLKQELKLIYGELEGEEAYEIKAELSEIYEKIDFSSYRLNESELTKQESERIKSSILQMQSVKNGQDPKGLQILDLGAGTGRLSVKLHEEGYEEVTAFEYEQKHVDLIRREDPNLKVIKGDWHRLNELIEASPWGPKKVDYAFSMGRTISHNRTPNNMVHMFDEVSQILKDGGRFMFDQPDINWGIYNDRIQRFHTNLVKKGIQPIRSGIVFDGPNDVDKFNRMILSTEQVDAIALLMGFRVVDTSHSMIGDNNEIKNIYYTYEKIDGWDPRSISKEDFMNSLLVLGLLDPGTDFDMRIDLWSATLGQEILYVQSGFGFCNEFTKILDREDRTPEVFVSKKGGKLYFDSRGSSKLNIWIGIITRDMSPVEVKKFVDDVRNQRIKIPELEVKALTKLGRTNS